MKLTDTGEARVNGYLFVLERSLRTFLPTDVAQDAVREVGSHIRERVAQVEPRPDERVALEQLLAELGPPMRVAQAYSTEFALDEAVTTGRMVPVARAVWNMAVTTVGGFFGALGLLLGYLSGLAFLALAVLKPIFPNNVGLLVGNDGPRALGGQFPLPPGTHAEGGYWIIPICLVIGFGILVGTHKGARKLLANLQRRWKGWRAPLERRERG